MLSGSATGRFCSLCSKTPPHLSLLRPARSTPRDQWKACHTRAFHCRSEQLVRQGKMHSVLPSRAYASSGSPRIAEVRLRRDGSNFLNQSHVGHDPVDTFVDTLTGVAVRHRLCERRGAALHSWQDPRAWLGWRPRWLALLALTSTREALLRATLAATQRQRLGG